MEREKLESMLIEYIDGALQENDRLLIEVELERNAEARILYSQLKEVLANIAGTSELIPGEALKNSFEQLLSQEMMKKPAAKPVMMIPMVYRIAAGIILLMVAGITAYWVRKDMQNQERIAAMEKALEENKRVMMDLLDNKYSASQRMQGVSVAYEMNKADTEIVTVLVKTFNTDPNTNVRLAALDALSKFSSEAEVRKSLVQSLATQKDPVIQIALIQLMVKMKEKGVIEQLERIATDGKTIKAVKTEAYSGILKLS